MFRIDNTKASSKNADGDAPDKCAACGKKAYDLQRGRTGEENRAGLKCCTDCFSVRYCGVPCQKKHRKQHRKECEDNAKKRRAFNDALLEKEISSDITPLPPQPDCDLCMHLMPPGIKASKFLGCCGKIICRACFARSSMPEFWSMMNGESTFESTAMNFMQNMSDLRSRERRCPFCRSPDDIVQLTKIGYAKRERCLESLADQGNSRAMLELAWVHQKGESAAALVNECEENVLIKGKGNRSYESDTIALEYFNKAADLENADAYYELSKKHRAEYNADDYLLCLNKAVNLGNIEARDDLAMLAMHKNQKHIALEHYKILAAAGYGNETTSTLTVGYKEGCVTKDELETALRAYHAARKEICSKERAHFERCTAGTSADGKVKTAGMYI